MTEGQSKAPFGCSAMPDEIEQTQIDAIAASLTIARPIFEVAYDEVAVRHDGLRFMQIARMANRFDKLDAGRGQDRRDFGAAMSEANAAGWLSEFVLEKFVDLAGSAEAPLLAQLQSVANRDQPFEDALKISVRTLAAMRRTCLILTSEKVGDGTTKERLLGSGFLIGPHLVLTNYHVIKGLLELGTMKPKPDGLRPLVRFDYHYGSKRPIGARDFATVDDWLVEASGDVPNVHDETEANFSERLDYAILRVLGRPGDARGFYDITKAKAPSAVGTTIHLWQFPKEQPIKVGSGARQSPPGRVALSNPPEGMVQPRLYHSVNALPGSSGGLLVNGGLQPIGLHEAGFQNTAAGDERVNRAIPLCRIADDAETAITDAVAGIPEKRGWDERRGTPLLGREDFQRHVFEAVEGTKRILIVRTIPRLNAATSVSERQGRLGRTFSRDLLEACLDHDEHHVVMLSASRIDPNPFETARRIVAEVDPSRVGTISPPTGETTLDADATGTLVDETIRALLAAIGGKTIWLMIDDIDAHPIGTQWASSSYLVALYRRIAREDRLRVVLVGLPKPLDGLNGIEDWISEELLERPPTSLEISDWMEAHLSHATPPDEFPIRLTVILRALSEERLKPNDAAPPGCRTEAIATLLKGCVRDAFKRTSLDHLEDGL